VALQYDVDVDRVKYCFSKGSVARMDEGKGKRLFGKKMRCKWFEGSNSNFRHGLVARAVRATPIISIIRSSSFREILQARINVRRELNGKKKKKKNLDLRRSLYVDHISSSGRSIQDILFQ